MKSPRTSYWRWHRRLLWIFPERDVENVRLRLVALLTEMEGIERDLGSEMDNVDPVPGLSARGILESKSIVRIICSGDSRISPPLRPTKRRSGVEVSAE